MTGRPIPTQHKLRLLPTIVSSLIGRSGSYTYRDWTSRSTPVTVAALKVALKTSQMAPGGSGVAVVVVHTEMEKSGFGELWGGVVKTVEGAKRVVVVPLTITLGDAGVPEMGAGVANVVVERGRVMSVAEAAGVGVAGWREKFGKGRVVRNGKGWMDSVQHGAMKVVEGAKTWGRWVRDAVAFDLPTAATTTTTTRGFTSPHAARQNSTHHNHQPDEFWKSIIILAASLLISCIALGAFFLTLGDVSGNGVGGRGGATLHPTLTPTTDVGMIITTTTTTPPPVLGIGQDAWKGPPTPDMATPAPPPSITITELVTTTTTLYVTATPETEKKEAEAAPDPDTVPDFYSFPHFSVPISLSLLDILADLREYVDTLRATHNASSSPDPPSSSTNQSEDTPTTIAEHTAWVVEQVWHHTHWVVQRFRRGAGVYRDVGVKVWEWVCGVWEGGVEGVW
ncbi:hypothetical protein HK104_002112 [Borealophlyctis nickersoniae]|nr:hypothetical protein HK104_002112 [Borealophlyctis nickersoniae]